MKVTYTLVFALALLSAPVVSYAQAPAADAAVVDEPITQPTVVYPAEAKQKHIQGAVEIEVHVSEKGNVTDVKALSGPEELRQAAIDAYKLASYHPMMRNGKAIPAVVKTKVEFSLHEAPPSPDDVLAKEFYPAHTRCETLALQKDTQAQEACEHALQLANRFSPGAYLEARAAAYNDMVVVLMNLGQTKQATQVGDDAVTFVADMQPGTMAAATAYITRAEARAKAVDLKGSGDDCKHAEDILHTLLQHETRPEIAANMRAQLKGTLTLHAVVLNRQHREGEAKRLQAEADRL